MTGGQLVAAATDRFGAFFSVTRSQVYRELPTLTAAGLLRLGEQGPRASQQYVLTPAGKRAFRAWLTDDTGADTLRSPLVLRLLHAGSLPTEERKELVRSGREAFGARLAAARTAARGEDRPVPARRRRLRRRPQPRHGQAARRGSRSTRGAVTRRRSVLNVAFRTSGGGRRHGLAA